jgi:hypothetical protein
VLGAAWIAAEGPRAARRTASVSWWVLEGGGGARVALFAPAWALLKAGERHRVRASTAGRKTELEEGASERPARARGVEWRGRLSTGRRRCRGAPRKTGGRRRLLTANISRGTGRWRWRTWGRWEGERIGNARPSSVIPSWRMKPQP